ncbi:hypothetical protein WICANDRAFT_103364 [Wickerhamomyces anomalus NRRL Y-366-8]|uniref:Zn(2)-C6 fungal-type domain-containing protein n=1 Tax=Wickerhamomyces anomalus (strain ATCC 58044 / CBS 1984 / NCYC 433 / NRRL Y-366-8) TaxID=683960 RepID=A0A1E3PB00_WICAA|nr:uncharacterized protein WICANDRAFT_103364 [Wickerhamomyces anomalus NRRL Y-366-8]ODQ62595.1 hypothetical protein WICANDRAFT_103364 [Wickerhamomyces anomalus NRRL Y-366-8]
MAVEQVKKEKPSNGPPKTKVIRAPGSQIERVAQACDRCRLKKTRCDGKRPQCSQCAAVGFECKVSDRLSRRAFPRGYTETLEERVRELEAENRRLTALLDLRDEQMELYSKVESTPDLSDSTGNHQPLSSSNLSLLNKGHDQNSKNGNGGLSLMTEYIDHDPKHVHSGPGCCANYPHSVNERPVSIAGSVDLDNGDLTDDEALPFNHDFSDSFNHNSNNPNNVSFEQNQAPGLPAAMAIARMNNSNSKRTQLATLVAMSIPRSTEETLFIPSLLSKIGETHGLDSRACLTTATAIASLKEIPKINSKLIQEKNNIINFTNINFKTITPAESNLFFNNLKLPPKYHLDQLITIYFQEWGMIIPILDKNDFLKQYVQFAKSFENKFNDNGMVYKERFGAIMILIVQLALLCQKNHNNAGSSPNGDSPNSNFQDADKDQILYYDYLIHQLINSSIASTCSIQSLQILSLALFYCLNTGDVITSYGLRGRVITMAQQLRLHRCPSAVLGNTGSTVSKFQQAERRILFWCIYTLDTFASLQLGVPRLLKDYEIECALPFGNDNLDDDNNINILIVNNNQVPLVGKVCNLSLAIMRYSKVLGNVLDSIFKRHSHSSSDNFQELTLIHENLLDNWRRDLPPNIKFELDVNGLLKDSKKLTNDKQMLLVLLYYSAKILIHLPVVASEVSKSRGSASYIVIQQCTIAILNILSDLYSKKTYYIPIPMNISRTKSRLAILSAKGSLEYTRGGALFQESKQILQNIINELKNENINEIPGNLSKNCVYLIESAIEAIISSPSNKDQISRKSSVDHKSKKTNSPLKQVEMQRTRAYSHSGPSPLSNNVQNFQQNLTSTTPSIKTESSEQLSNMLSQLDSIPPISFDSSTAAQRVPVNRQRSVSVSQPTPQHFIPSPKDQQQQQAFKSTYLGSSSSGGPPSNSGDSVNSFEEQQTMEYDFGADGSLGLAPWLDFDLNGFDFGGYNVSVNGELTPSEQQQQLQSGFQGSNPVQVKLEPDLTGGSHSSNVSFGQQQQQGQAQRSGSLFDWQNSNMGM